jgi:ATP-dependent Clp protease ATP-binding subunit ClpA
MFERFTTAARATVIGAQENARRFRHGYVGTEHLLLSLAGQDAGAGPLLRDSGVTTAGVEEAIERLVGSRAPLGESDAAALRAIGIDLDQVIARIEENFGPVPLTPPPDPPRRRFWLSRSGREVPARRGGSPRFTPRSKKVLELSLREALRLGQKWIGTEHILLGLLREGEGLAAQILAESGVNFDELRRQTETALRSAA